MRNSIINNSTRQSDGRFLSVLFFCVLPAQVFLLMLTGLNNMIDGLVGSNLLGTEKICTDMISIPASSPDSTVSLLMK